MINVVKGKKVKIGVAFLTEDCSCPHTKYYDGVIKTSSTLGGEMFVVFEDNFMINTKYIQTIEIIG